MCEVLAVRCSQPLPFTEVLPWAEKMEYYGLGSFGWGVAWLDDGRVRGYRYPGRLAEDTGSRDRLAGVASTHYLVHFRRPTRLGTTQLADTQPFLAANGRFAFCHNGYFSKEADYRERYAGRLEGRADSEVGFRMFEDFIADGVAPEEAVRRTHDELQGNANIGYLGADGELVVFNAYPKNQLYRFRMRDADLAATELHSPDDSLFHLIFPGASDRRKVMGADILAAPETAR
jgi:predicted glutamine amidotransferase